MFGFTSTSSVDWSYYGGAEQIAPTSSSKSSASSSISSSSSTSRSRSRSDSPDSLTDESSVEQLLTSNSSPAGLRWAPKYPATPQDPTDFLWLLTEEPHRTRRMAIIAAHPEVKSLMGLEPLTKYISFMVTLTQILIAVYMGVHQIHPLDWRFLLTAYVIGGTLNQNTFLAIHEITHNLAFKGIKANRIWACGVNLAIGVPYAMMFKVSIDMKEKSVHVEGGTIELERRGEWKQEVERIRGRSPSSSRS